MKITYDPKYNIAYILLKEKTDKVNSIKISEEMIIDMADYCSIYGVELLNSNEQLNNAHDGKFEIINLLTGNTQDFLLPV